ncbi:MAG: helix-turn-helix transcriptional regulator [Proteobacteria bacterium]|nr:helix-turn-helix transcriptional regulator [Pseudomonadota bacterium]
MIRFRLQELLAEKQFKEGRRVTLTELSETTGINRVTISKMVNQRGYSTVTDNLDKLCKFFNCKVGELAEFVPDEETQEHPVSRQT